MRNKWIKDDPFTGYKLKGKPVHRECLDANELQKIIKKKFTTSRLSQVRDFFLFSCYTGLSYADVQKLKLSDIGIGVDGERWIFSKRKKQIPGSPFPYCLWLQRYWTNTAVHLFASARTGHCRFPVIKR